MTSDSLARSYLLKAQKRLKALAVLREEDAHSDVVREAQELVELALKGVLRAIGVTAEVPRRRRVAPRASDKLAPEARVDAPRAAEISKRLRRERELAFYGDIDFIPTEEYSADDGRRAYEEAAWVSIWPRE